MAVFALLDDAHSTPQQPTSRLYRDWVREHRCSDPAALDGVWAAVDRDLRAGLHAVVLADYEWGAKLLRAGHAGLAVDDTASLRVLMFRELMHLSRAQVDAWLSAPSPPWGEGGGEGPGAAASQHAGPHPNPLPGGEGAREGGVGLGVGAAGVMNLVASVDRDAFTAAIERIHEAIRAGETYQVNYTYRLTGQAHGEPIDLYRRLRQRQPVAYGALIALPEGGHVLSCSPELFLRHDAGLLTARPMKGTAPRIPAPESDSETARLLSEDIKNRAENLMIVDLLRNDLGRLAETGSVNVPALFAIEPYATVFQMTSTVQARLRPGVGMPELLRAVYPCGSITGAPKHHTMELIARLETTPRGLYCGAIGWVDAPKAGARIGDFCLSVAIRTLTLGPEKQGLRAARLGIGAGIVIDSRAADEYDECRLKARFLTDLDPGFELFETMFASPTEGIRHLDLHLARLARSARVFGFPFERADLLAAIDAAMSRLAAGGPSRLRLALAYNGRMQVTHAPLAPLPNGGAGVGAGVDAAVEAVGLVLAPEPLPAVNPLAAHKTTQRAHYDAGVRAAEQAGAFDSLFFDAADRLIEGGRSNVFLKLGGRWFTPPVAGGALPGVMRGLLLADPAWGAAERELTRADLLGAEAIMVCNALRGPLVGQLLAVAAA